MGLAPHDEARDADGGGRRGGRQQQQQQQQQQQHAAGGGGLVGPAKVGRREEFRLMMRCDMYDTSNNVIKSMFGAIASFASRQCVEPCAEPPFYHQPNLLSKYAFRPTSRRVWGVLEA